MGMAAAAIGMIADDISRRGAREIEVVLADGAEQVGMMMACAGTRPMDPG